MTEIKTRKLRPLECFSAYAGPIELYIQSADRVLEKGDKVIFCGHNDSHVELQIESVDGVRRWISIIDDSVFIEVPA